MENKTQSSGGFGLLGIVIALAVVALVGFGGWYVWQARTHKNNTTNNATTTGTTSSNQNGSNNTQASDQNIFKIPELGVKFEIKDGITPLYLYSASDLTWDSISYQSVPFSTQQLVDKGAAEANGGNNICSFSKDSSGSFPLTSVLVFNSASDALTFLKVNSDTHLATSDMTAANGFFTISNKVFYVPQGVSGGLCLQDTAFETQQWEALHQSLMTLKAIQ